MIAGMDEVGQRFSRGLGSGFTLVLGLAVAIVAGRVTTEASGGVNLDTVRAIAETGVDLISVGALTHSAAVLDLGLDTRIDD